MRVDSAAYKRPFFYRLKKDFKRNYTLYILLSVVIAFYIIFMYVPMYGAIIAFKNYSPAKGILGSPWAKNGGMEHFIRFFNGPYFTRLIRNTFLISFYDLIFGFPAPIILALLINEVKNRAFKKTVQTISYMPYFISLIVVVGMIKQFSATNGFFNDIIAFFGGTRSPILNNPNLYRPIYVASNIWQGVGWGSVIYLAALSGVDAQLYEAATIDGANKWKQMLHVTLPGISPTIIIMLILRIGSLMSVGYEKTILLYNDAVMKTADVISSYVYRVGILDTSWSYSTAVGLFNSIINFILVLGANWISRKVSETSLW